MIIPRLKVRELFLTETLKIYTRPTVWLDLIPSLDCRSLGIARISVAVILLWDLWSRWSVAELFMTDSGYLPRELVQHFWGHWKSQTLYSLTGSLAGQRVLLGVHAVCAIFLLIGWRTRVFTFLCWLFTLSLHHRNPFMLNIGDSILTIFLFWAIFLPWGRCYSVDKHETLKGEHPYRYRSMASFAWVFQVLLIYVTSGLWKLNRFWIGDKTALSLVLRSDIANSLGISLSGLSSAMAAIGLAIVILELVGPFLLFGGEKARLVALIAFFVYHLGLSLTLRLGFFTVVCLAVLLSLLPSLVWVRRLRNQSVYVQNGRFDKLALVFLLVLMISALVPVATRKPNFLRNNSWRAVRGFNQIFEAPGLLQLFPIFAKPQRANLAYQLTWTENGQSQGNSQVMMPGDLDRYSRRYLGSISRVKFGSRAVPRFLRVEAERRNLEGGKLSLWRHTVTQPEKRQLLGELNLE